MGKTRKIDVRLTPELDEWIKQEAGNLSLSKSSYARMLLEQLRRESQSSVEEEQAPFRARPKNTGDDRAS